LILGAGVVLVTGVLVTRVARRLRNGDLPMRDGRHVIDVEE
jgi:hypothetical protein